MKRCPQCGREYDSSMMFCLDDGAELLYGPATDLISPDESATAILHETAPPAEAATRAQIHTTDRTTFLPSDIGNTARKPFDRRLLLAPVALIVIALVGFVGYRYFSPAKQIESIAVMPFVNGNELVEIDPSFFLGHLVVAYAQQKKGMFPEALASYKRMRELNDDPNYYMGNVATLYADWGKRDDVLRILEETKQVAARRYVSPYVFAVIYSRLGLKDAALEQLERSRESKRPEFKYVAIDNSFSDLRSDPRFADLLRRVGLSR